MIIIRLSGGLGNQMFQYAAGRRLAYINHCPLKLDLAHYARNPTRQYDLGVFNIQAEITLPEEIKRFDASYDKLRRLKHWLYVRLPKRSWQWVRQESILFQPSVLELRGNIYLDGMWQSEKYFQDVVALIRHNFTLKESPRGQNAKLVEHIRSVEAVSLHVRRGDYVTNPATSRVHGVCSPDYYAGAVRLMMTKTLKPHLFVFSDDTAWARENLRLAVPVTIVAHNNSYHVHEDLRLMSMCRHHIIANSSFSWWGAWLNPGAGKIVIAPRQWYRNPQVDTRDCLPGDWIQC